MGDLEKQVEHREYSRHERPRTFMSASYEISANTARDIDRGGSRDPFRIEGYASSISQVSTSSQVFSKHLKRSLKSRHLAMISLGGTIGQGLFLSSGANLSQGGPGGALIAYAIIGFIAFWVTYSLGEMATYIPISGSFTIYCRRFVDDSFGTTIGYNYWACWAVIVSSELVALPLIMKFWTEVVPDWAWSGIWLLVIFIVNLFGARSYGETEYWFSLIKILAVVIFIIVGCLVSGGLIDGQVYGFKYWHDPGAFPRGVQGVIDALVLASFSMQGTEIVGITAGEAGNPTKEVPRAINNVVWRILIFYLCSVFVMGMVIPYTDGRLLQTDTSRVNVSNVTTISPFTMVFQKGSLDSVAHIMNAVILITVLSCANSGLYVASRTLLALSEEGYAWHKLSYISDRGVPVYSVICTALVSLIAFATSFIPGKSLFQVLTTLSGVAGLVTWAGICVAHYRFRRAFKAQGRDLDELPMRAPCFPFGDLFDIAACTVIALMTGYRSFSPPSAVGLTGHYLGLIFTVIGFLVLKFYTKSQLVRLEDIDLDTGRSELSTLDVTNEKKVEGPWLRRIFKKIYIAIN